MSDQQSVRVAIISAVAAIIVGLIAGSVALKNHAKTDETLKKVVIAEIVAGQAKDEAKQAVDLASSKGDCRDGSELSQQFFDRPIEVVPVVNGGRNDIDLRTAETSVRRLPDEVPQNAKFVQVLATITTGNANEPGDHRFLKVSSKANSSEDCSFYLYFRASIANSYAYNSSGSWLPIAPDRILSAAMISINDSPVTALPGNASATALLFVTAYR